MNTEKRSGISSGKPTMANRYSGQRGLPASPARALRAGGRTRQAGVTLIDTIVGSVLMLVVFLGIAAVFKLSIDVVTNNKARAGAITLANERMEYIRSLAYASVGTVGGVPSGTIPQSETVMLNGVSHTRRTVVEYVDDPGDGIGAADTNSITLDYKVAKVDVAWTSRIGTRHITLVTRISPPNGMEVACPPTALCGTLTINVLNVAIQPVINAQVHIVNTTTSPGVDITTYTNTAGVVSIVGAPAAAGYQVTVTKTGYSTDQTYNITAQNTNPAPGPLTVSSNQTTPGTFKIDYVGTKTIYTLTTVLVGTWNDDFAGMSKIATSTNITVTGGAAKLADDSGSFPSYGELQSIAVAPANLAHWKALLLTDNIPPQTEIRYRVYDGSGENVIPDSQIPGNSAGFTASSSPVDLSNVSTSTHSSFRVDAVLKSSDSVSTPSIDSYAITYDYGPLPLPNIPMTVRGSKTIGIGPSGTIFKYSAAQNSGTNAVVNLPNMEWDDYSTTVAGTTGYDVASSCDPQPETLDPSATTNTYLYLTPHTTNSLLVDVTSVGVLIQNASVRLFGAGYDTTLTTDHCGQVFFSNVPSATYSVTVSASGYIPATQDNVNISGTSRLSVLMSQ